MRYSTVISLRLPDSLDARLDAAAQRNGVSKAELLRDAAETYLDTLAVRELARQREATGWPA